MFVAGWRHALRSEWPFIIIIIIIIIIRTNIRTNVTMSLASSYCVLHRIPSPHSRVETLLLLICSVAAQVIIIIIIEGLSLLQSIPPTTADKQTQAQKRRGSRYAAQVSYTNTRYTDIRYPPQSQLLKTSHAPPRVRMNIGLEAVECINNQNTCLNMITYGRA